ncbi:MAG: metallophosphoesterase, partial [Victivallales bacterium]|nr:metallophosphoesterase [Victivallales bacterium]
MQASSDSKIALPYTDKPLLDNPQDFHFAIIADRTGGERKGPFGETMKALNLLRPEFTICVGDLVEGCYGSPTEQQAEKRMNDEWNELENFIDKLDMRFYYVVGNHDINLGWPNNHLAHDVSKRVWMERHGNKTYYDFMVKNCHFICLDSMDGRDGRIPVQGITDEQYAWARQ